MREAERERETSIVTPNTITFAVTEAIALIHNRSAYHTDQMMVANAKMGYATCYRKTDNFKLNHLIFHPQTV